MLLDLADQLDSLRTVSPQPKGSVLGLGDKDGPKDKTPKKGKSANTEDTPKKQHKSCEEKGQLRHNSAEKSPALLTCKPNVNFDASRLGTAVAWACLSVTRMMKLVEDTHNLKVAEALLTRQCLEKASAKAIDLGMEEIQGAHTPADMWRVEKKISACISHERAKAYEALIEQHCPKPELSMGKDGSGNGFGQMAKAEEEYCKSMTDLISTVLTEGVKIPGGHGVALTSNMLQLVSSLPLNPVLTPCIDLPPEKESRVVPGETLRSISMSHTALSLLPSSPLTGGTSGSMPTGRSTIQFGQAMIWPITHVLPAVDYTFFKKPLPVGVAAPPTGWKSPGATSTPMSKAPPQSSLEELDTAEPTVDLTGLNDDETFTPCKTDQLRLKETHRSSK